MLLLNIRTATFTTYKTFLIDQIYLQQLICQYLSALLPTFNLLLLWLFTYWPTASGLEGLSVIQDISHVKYGPIRSR